MNKIWLKFGQRWLKIITYPNLIQTLSQLFQKMTYPKVYLDFPDKMWIKSR